MPQKWSKLGQKWQTMAKIGQNGSNWSEWPKLAKHGQIGQRVQNWPKLANMAEIGPILDKPKLAKISQIGKNPRQESNVLMEPMQLLIICVGTA